MHGHTGREYEVSNKYAIRTKHQQQQTSTMRVRESANQWDDRQTAQRASEWVSEKKQH